MTNEPHTLDVESLDFETAMSQLEQVVNDLDGEIKLEQALVLFERGVKLSTRCRQFLKQAEQKVEVLKQACNGELELTELSPAEEQDSA